MKKFYTFIVAAGIVLMMSTSVYAAKKVMMRVGDIENVANLGAVALDRFAEQIEQKSRGSFKVKAFHASQMGSANKQLQLVKSGTLQAFRGSISWLAQFDTGFSLWLYVF